MFAYIKGTLVYFNSSLAIVDVQGIGYSLFISSSTFGNLSQIGETVQFFTSFVVRELSQSLYGFLNAQERDLFEGLLNVTGVGPKLALSLIGHLSPSHLQAAISQEDVATLCKVPGVGKKTAERLIIELRDKINSWTFSHVSELKIALNRDPKLQRIQDAILALVNLGYTQAVAQKAVKASLNELPQEYELPELITSALQGIHKG